jgi:hypothetical protein
MSAMSFIALRFEAGRLTAVAPWSFSPTGPALETDLIWQEASTSVAELILDTMCSLSVPSWGRDQALPEQKSGRGTFVIAGHLSGEAVFVAIDPITLTMTLRKCGSWNLRGGPEAQIRFFEALDDVRDSIKVPVPPHFALDEATVGRLLDPLEVDQLNEDGQIPVNLFSRLGKLLEKDRRAQVSREKAGQPHGGTHVAL